MALQILINYVFSFKRSLCVGLRVIRQSASPPSLKRLHERLTGRLHEAYEISKSLLKHEYLIALQDYFFFIQDLYVGPHQLF